ncbi:PTS system N-acetylgalactosamine-specific IIA component [Melghirimyces profundicolus]|uniref:PTS system N-acetylgalactosamine-specific IIA component n=1 Tax=Melghirimyces profundicolus TaxID=1242148 RepID=A0A2T6BD52_9BACL|nr:PTS galactosamine/N-acetylgalactosamine transporter subunit IIA [Melghirimyces profundicolus]PTX53997.1 PTS system N-acetylgalactosamine-specific IIA component [Melghirimyces profundicolus]
MIGVVIVGHGGFASALRSAVELVVGKQRKTADVSFDPQDSTEDLEKKLKGAVAGLQPATGILFFTDLAGGTPFKVSALLSREMERASVIAGTNLPMLLEVLLGREHLSTEQAVEKAIQAGKDGIKTFP